MIREFDQFSPGGTASASPEIIRQDQESLQAVSERIRRFVNERLAHHARDARYNAVTFAEVHAALDELGRLLQRYSLLLKRIGLVTAARDHGRLESCLQDLLASRGGRIAGARPPLDPR